MEKEYTLPLVDIRKIGKGSSLLTFRCEEIAKRANPGQFVNVSCGLFLKRPFGICSVNEKTGEFTVGVREVGEGTKEICAARIGDAFQILGPLGNGFSFEGVNKLIAVGGGTGVFPLHFALQRATALGIKTHCINGYRSCEDTFFLDECSFVSDQFSVSTDTGDYGFKGTVIDVLNSLSADSLLDSHVFTVGPEIMMKKVSEWASDHHLVCQVSMEKRMACGIGACLVCVCKVKAEQEGREFRHVRCCKEGPVMEASKIIW